MKRANKLAVWAGQLLINTLLILLFSVAVAMVLPVEPLMVAGGLVVFFVVLQFLSHALRERHPKGLMMAIVAYSCADEPGAVGAAYTQAGNCLEEGSTFIGFFLVKKGFNIGSIADQTAYDAAKTAKDIVPVRDVEAFMTAGTPSVGKSRNGRPGRLTRIDWDIPFTYEGVDSNLHFQNALNHSRNYGVAFVSEEYKVFCPLDRNLEPVLASFFATPQGDQEYGQTRYFGGNIKYTSKDLPQLLDNAGLAKSIIIADFQP